MHLSNSIDVGSETLCGIEAFCRLPLRERAALAALCDRARYREGQRILACEDRRRDVYFIVSGSVQATIFSPSGRQVTLQNLGPGEMFGELSALDGAPRCADVVATTDVLILSLPPDQFVHAVFHHPCVADATLRRLVGMVRMLSERVFEVSALPVRQRVSAEMLRLALRHKCHGNRVVISPAPTHSDFACQIGTHREAVTRGLGQLRKLGLINVSRGKWEVNNITALRAVVEQALGAIVATGPVPNPLHQTVLNHQGGAGNPPIRVG